MTDHRNPSGASRKRRAPPKALPSLVVPIASLVVVLVAIVLLISKMQNVSILDMMADRTGVHVHAVNSNPTPSTRESIRPNNISLSFKLNRKATADPAKYLSTLRFQYFTPDIGGSAQVPLTPDDYRWDWPYQPQGFWLKGVVVPVIKNGFADDLKHAAHICLVPPQSPMASQTELVPLTCEENRDCRPSAASDINICEANTARAEAWWRNLLRGDVAFAGQTETARWVTPSVATLAKDEHQTGWAHFRISTNAFVGSLVRSVEVEIRVNGRLVDEDGLTAAERPTRNDPTKPWTYEFALQTLNFEGADFGCDHVTVTLTPLLGADSGHAEALGRVDRSRGGTAELQYAAMRSQPPRQVKLGGSTLTWRVDFDRPAGPEWRNELFLQPYGYDPNDPVGYRRAGGDAMRDKVWFDRMSIVYPGAGRLRLRGVVRPPLLPAKPNFGLVVGWLDNIDGQIRFTGQPKLLTDLAAWLQYHWSDPGLFTTPADRAIAKRLFHSWKPGDPYIRSVRTGDQAGDGTCAATPG